MPESQPHLTRRTFLHWLAAATAGMAASCVAPARQPTPESGDTSTALPTAASTNTLALSPAPSWSPSPTVRTLATPTGSPTAIGSPTAAPSASERISSILIFIQENHTFDSLFAAFPGADGQSAGSDCPDHLRADPPHQHGDALRRVSNTTAAARCSYNAQDAALYWQLAQQFTLCDRYFSEMRGPSHPNFFMLTSAQTPIMNTPFPNDTCPAFCYDVPTLADRLDERKLSWRDYGGIFTDIKRMASRPEVMDRQDAQYFADAAAGTLPNVAWLNSVFLKNGTALSGHPPASLCAAQQYAAKVINAAMAGPQWNSTAIFLIWDDWGGFYDHVDPPVVERWSDGTPLRYGYRVPCLVISPFARGGYVSHELHSHVSLLHFAETVYGLASLNQRDAQASALLDCFDFSQVPHPPTTLPAVQCSG